MGAARAASRLSAADSWSPARHSGYKTGLLGEAWLLPAGGLRLEPLAPVRVL